ncbi:MAG: hypothetical protein FJ102_16920 [Deltaproteobacteria bacterium]|nr:hypothetical protein [Deltaproteobacteria bacterium]
MSVEPTDLYIDIPGEAPVHEAQNTFTTDIAVHLVRYDGHTDEGVSTNSIFNIWDAANPDTWQANGTGAGYVCGSTNWPAGRLRCAADTRGYLAEWDSQDNQNGVHR